MAQPRLQEISTRRGGDKNSPIHLLQMILATALLVVAAGLLISRYDIIGFVVMVIGVVLSLVNFRFR